jgi:hypothetical protein
MGQAYLSTNAITVSTNIAVASAPYYYLLPIAGSGITSFQISHLDATSAYSAILYTSNYGSPPVPATGGAVNLIYWQSEAVDFPLTTVTAGAAGSKIYHVGNCGAAWGLLRITPTAASDITIMINGKD